MIFETLKDKYIKAKMEFEHEYPYEEFESYEEWEGHYIDWHEDDERDK